MSKIFLIIFFILVSSNSVLSQNTNGSEESILRTDNLGNIIGGDKKDWNYDQRGYEYFLKYKDLFDRPFVQSDVHTAAVPTPLFAHVDINDVTIWYEGEIQSEIKEFFAERNNVNDTTWVKVGKAYNSGNKTKGVVFTDNNVEEGVYMYRFYYMHENNKAYINLPRRVYVKSYKDFQLFPAYPNPMSEEIFVSFYLPKRQVVKLFFTDGIDTTYILKDFIQEQSYYNLEVPKRDIKFVDKTVRVQLECESCGKDSYGDVQILSSPPK